MNTRVLTLAPENFEVTNGVKQDRLMEQTLFQHDVFCHAHGRFLEQLYWLPIRAQNYNASLKLRPT